MTCGGDFCTLWKPRPASPVDCRQTPAGRRLSKALSKIWAGCPSGGPFLVPPRKGERMRLKEALKGLLPQTNPSSLRILPARISFRKAGFRRFLRKHPRIQHIPCQCAHWRGIEDHFGFWNDCRWQSPPAAFCKIVLGTGGKRLTKPRKWGIVKTQRVLPVGRLPLHHREVTVILEEWRLLLFAILENQSNNS